MIVTEGIKALSAPFGDVRFVPTGGITPHNVRSYIDLPSVLAVGCSWMVPRDLVSSGDADAIRALVEGAVTVLRGTGGRPS